MRIKTVEIDAEVEAVLRGGEWKGWLFVLPPGQLDRALYVRVDKVLRALGGKWNRSHGGHMFGMDAKDQLVAALDQGSVVDQKKTLEQFFTPADVASRMVAMLDIRAGQHVLEPSAGNGRLIWEAIERGAHVDAVELDAKLASELISTLQRMRKNSIVSIHPADFMEWSPPNGKLYDIVIMNPPFGRGADILHILRAWRFLRPGGKLAAILSPHWSFGADRGSAEFRKLIELHGGKIETLPPGTFRAEGTLVRADLLFMEKPA